MLITQFSAAQSVTVQQELPVIYVVEGTLVSNFSTVSAFIVSADSQTVASFVVYQDTVTESVQSIKSNAVVKPIKAAVLDVATTAATAPTATTATEAKHQVINRHEDNSPNSLFYIKSIFSFIVPSTKPYQSAIMLQDLNKSLAFFCVSKLISFNYYTSRFTSSGIKTIFKTRPPPAEQAFFVCYNSNYAFNIVQKTT